MESIGALGWVDITTLVVIALFFVLGLFKGMWWQVSRIATLVASYAVAVLYGPDLGAWLAGWMHGDFPGPEQQETALYLGYLLAFLAVLIALSLIAVLVQKLLAKAGLTFYDRLGGGLLGLATGAAVVLCLLGGSLMFFGDSDPVQAAETSHTMRYSRKLVDSLGTLVPDEMRKAWELPPLSPPAGGEGDSADDPPDKPQSGTGSKR